VPRPFGCPHHLPGLRLLMRTDWGTVVSSALSMKDKLMRTGRIALVAGILFGGHGNALAQTTRTFSGVWKTPSDVVPGHPVPAPGKTGAGAKGKSTLAIQQSSDSLIVTGGLVRSAYALDGSPTKNYVLEGTNNAHVPVQSRAHWEGNELVLVDRYELSDGLKMFVTRRLSIDADGNLQWRQRMVSRVGVMNLSSTYVPQRTLVP
jgi:hypothetical protein